MRGARRWRRWLTGRSSEEVDRQLTGKTCFQGGRSRATGLGSQEETATLGSAASKEAPTVAPRLTSADYAWSSACRCRKANRRKASRVRASCTVSRLNQ